MRVAAFLILTLLALLAAALFVLVLIVKFPVLDTDSTPRVVLAFSLGLTIVLGLAARRTWRQHLRV